MPMPEPTEEELAAEEKRRQKRIRDHEKYLRQKERKQKIAEGLIVPGEPYQLVCQCCGEPFQSVRPNAKFCKPACREKFYRQEKRKAKETETSQTALQVDDHGSVFRALRLMDGRSMAKNTSCAVAGPPP